MHCEAPGGDFRLHSISSNLVGDRPECKNAIDEEARSTAASRSPATRADDLTSRSGSTDFVVRNAGPGQTSVVLLCVLWHSDLIVQWLEQHGRNLHVSNDNFDIQRPTISGVIESRAIQPKAAASLLRCRARAAIARNPSSHPVPAATVRRGDSGAGAGARRGASAWRVLRPARQKWQGPAQDVGQRVRHLPLRLRLCARTNEILDLSGLTSSAPPHTTRLHIPGVVRCPSSSTPVALVRHDMLRHDMLVGRRP